MADSGEKQDKVWPLTKFHFKFESESIKEATFSEVSGLEAQAHAIEYRDGDSRQISINQIPSQSSSTVTLKRGLFADGSAFFDWFSNVQMGNIKPENVTIKLLDQERNATMAWTLHNAWPTQLTGGEINADATEVVIESLVLAYESITMERS